MRRIDRRTFLRRATVAAGGLAIGGPLQAFAMRMASASSVEADRYGPLVNMGDLWLPESFRYRVVSRQGDTMTDRSPTPGIFDGMAAFATSTGLVLIRNHENRRLPGEIPVVVPPEKRYDPDPSYNGGCTKLVLTPDRQLIRSHAVLGGTSTNCAGGRMPWGSWITCEEVFETSSARRHGYAFEIVSSATGAVVPTPIRRAGRFVHEAVALYDGILYETEDQPSNAGFYRFVPDTRPLRAGDLAGSNGRLQALRLAGIPNANMNVGWPAGIPLPVEWVTINDPDPPSDTVRLEAQVKGAAAFNRQEGIWVGDGRIYFDCTDGGAAGVGQIWAFHPAAQTLTLIYESPGPWELNHPDNLVVAPSGDLFLCEDTNAPLYVRGLTRDGRIYDFARAASNTTEFAGVCFDPWGRTMYVNQQGNRSTQPAVTYAIWGPW